MKTEKACVILPSPFAGHISRNPPT